MKILLCHNYYQQRGGEDQSYEDEARLLEGRGHRVLRFTIHNDSIGGMGQLRLAARTFWNRDVHARLRQLLRDERPHVMHCTNTFPLLSPASYYAARAEGVAVVQSLRNYRLLCSNALFLRDGRACEECLGRRVGVAAIKHRCYRGSLPATAVVTLMVAAHRAIGTWNSAVNLYFTPSEFARQKYIQGGFPADRIAVKPNFVLPDPGPGVGLDGGAIFVGRLSPEKGVGTLLAAWREHDLGATMPLTIVGDGPMADEVRAACAAWPDRIKWLGRRPLVEALEHIGRAALLVSPSIAYETFGRTIVEAFAKGTPVLTSDSGASAELVDPGRTGLIFRTSDAADLAAKVRELATAPSQLRAMRRNARAEYERTYNADTNYRMLMDIYRRAIESCGSPIAPPDQAEMEAVTAELLSGAAADDGDDGCNVGCACSVKNARRLPVIESRPDAASPAPAAAPLASAAGNARAQA